VAALFGFLGFVAALFVVGAFMEGNMRKVGIAGAAFVACAIVILAFDKPRSNSGGRDCWTEWDMRASRTVCD